MEEFAAEAWMIYPSGSCVSCPLKMPFKYLAAIIPTDYYLIAMEIPDSADIFILEVFSFGPDWENFPHSDVTQLDGEKFIMHQEFLIMKVSDIIVQGDFNEQMNPLRFQMDQVKII